jgi:hypothetical protein
MSRRRSRNKPSTPEEIAARRQKLRDAAAEAQRLKDQGAEVSQDPRTGEIAGAFKPDVVVLMRREEAITPSDEAAVRKFEELIQKASGGSSSSLAVLDRVSGGDIGDRGVGAHVQAAKDLEERRKRMDLVTWPLLRELCDGNLLVTRWRKVIERRTGETNPKAQAGIVRQVFRVLAAVEEQIRNERTRRPANDDRQHDAVPLAG